MASKVPIDLGEAHDRLLDKRRRLVNRRRLHDRDREELSETRSIEANEAASTDEIRDELAQLSEAERDQLIAIDDALARIQDGRYGLCSECGEPIDPARLRALPEASTCLPCAELPAEEGMAPERRSQTERVTGQPLMPDSRRVVDES